VNQWILEIENHELCQLRPGGKPCWAFACGSSRKVGVIAGLVPAISIRGHSANLIEMAGTSPAMTTRSVKLDGKCSKVLGAIRMAGGIVGAPLQTSPLIFIALCGHRRRIDADFSREIPLRLHSIVVYNEPH
jgi:hypothetical protein